MLYAVILALLTVELIREHEVDSAYLGLFFIIAPIGLVIFGINRVLIAKVYAKSSKKNEEISALRDEITKINTLFAEDEEKLSIEEVAMSEELLFLNEKNG